MKAVVHHTSKRAWGFETLLTVTDNNGDVWGECITTKDYPKDYTGVILEAESNVTRRLTAKSEELEISKLEDRKTSLATELADIQSQIDVLKAVK